MPLGPKEKGAREPRKLSRKGATMIADFEGGASPDGKFRPYWDAAGGVWTQGFGHTRDVDPNDRPWSLRRAKRELRKDSAPVAELVLRQCKFELKPHQLDALISAGFNLGPGIFMRGRSLGDALLAAGKDASPAELRRIADAFKLYTYAGGNELPGLVSRRKRERHVFLYGYKKRRR